MNLRPYQLAAVEGTFREWENVQSTLCVMPVGTGKTTVAAEIIKRTFPKRALFLCHRLELVTQAYHSIRNHTGFEIDVEMADQFATTTMWGKTPVVVATVQTLSRGRMKRFNPQDFGLLVADESHHSVSPSWRLVIDYFKTNKELKVLNLTATPDRADEEALGQVIDSVAYDYEILDAISDGYLVPVTQQMVTIEGLDFSNVRTTAGDLNGADLAKVMEAEKTLQGVVSATIDIVGDKRTLLFAVTVKQAETYADIFNRHKPGMADYVCGSTPDYKRKEVFDNFTSGKTQVLCNVGIVTEGVDIPAIECVVMARPTKSRSLYCQCIGRSMRPIAEFGYSIVDQYATAEERKNAIAASSKRTALVVDFVGNSGRHKLMTAIDILGGKYNDQEIARALEVAKQGSPVRIDRLLEEEAKKLYEEQEERKRAALANRTKLIGKATFVSETIDAFNAFDLRMDRIRAWDAGKEISEKMAGMLRKMGLDPTKMSYSQAKQLITEQFRRWDNKLCSLKQAKLLKKYGYDTKDLTFERAGVLITGLKQNGWRRTG